MSTAADLVFAQTHTSTFILVFQHAAKLFQHALVNSNGEHCFLHQGLYDDRDKTVAGKALFRGLETFRGVLLHIGVGLAQGGVLALAEGMAGHDLHLPAAETPQKGRHGRQVLVGIVEARHQGHAHAHFGGGSERGLQVAQDEGIVLPGELFVLFRVHVLAVEQEKVGQVDGLVEAVLGAEATGIHGDVQALVMGGLHQIEEELPARRGLATAKGHAAAGVLVEEPVLADHFHDVFHGHDTAGHDARLAGTDLGTGAAMGASFRIAAHLAALQRHHGAAGTDPHTLI